MRQYLTRLQLTLLIILLVSSVAWSIDAIEFESEEDQERFQTLTFELRCPLCQNQNLTDSNSKISVDLRREVVRLIKDGKTDKEIKDHMVSLYGDFILYKPPVQNNTLVLWFGPIVMAGVALIIFATIVLNRSRLAANVEDEFDDLYSNEDEIENDYQEQDENTIGTAVSKDDPTNESDSKSDSVK